MKETCRNRLRIILAEREKTDRWLANKVHVSEMTMSRLTPNKIQSSLAQFITIYKALNVELKDLIEL